MKLKTGIIGCGKVGDFHAKAYAQLENSEFTAVCDANLERAKAFAERYNVHAYSDIAEMIQKEHLDVVSVCTPHPIHCDPAVTAAENGCNVLIEKPLASSLADCDRIIEAGDKNHVTIGTMVQRRFYRPCMRIHEAIEAGKIGKPVLGMVTRAGVIRPTTTATHGAALGRAKAAAFWSTRHPISLTCCCGTWATSMKYTASGRI